MEGLMSAEGEVCWVQTVPGLVEELLRELHGRLKELIQMEYVPLELECRGGGVQWIPGIEQLLSLLKTFSEVLRTVSVSRSLV